MSGDVNAFQHKLVGTLICDVMQQRYLYISNQPIQSVSSSLRLTTITHALHMDLSSNSTLVKAQSRRLTSKYSLGHRVSPLRLFFFF